MGFETRGWGGGGYSLYFPCTYLHQNAPFMAFPDDLAGVVAADVTALADAGMVTVGVADLAEAGTEFVAWGCHRRCGSSGRCWNGRCRSG